ncbi:MAG: hypothetical protein NC131_21260, partial [Roseburia sp.]|nr:hypothetical protein [Roseburia sp.]
MAKFIKIRKGLNIPLQGEALGEIEYDTKTVEFALCPDDYPGHTWKAIVKQDDNVKCGDPLLCAKDDNDLCIVSPISGKVKEIHRGERRKIEFISVLKDETHASADFNETDSLLKLKRSGLFSLMRQRPFDIVPDSSKTPRDIFVTAFDTAPLAGNMKDSPLFEYLEKGIEILKSLTTGDVYLSVLEGSGIDSEIATVYEFNNLHPAGNVGTQIAAISPINKGEIIWTLDAVTACRIGKLFSIGVIDFSTVVAVTGPEINNPHLISTYFGAKISSLIDSEVKNNNDRIISGNVLTGEKVSLEDGYLRYPYRQITAIEEGDHADEMMGWLSLNPKRYSVSHAFPAFLRGLSKPFNFDARIKGGERAMIMSGEYDKVFPMEIYPEFLLKAIIAKN